MIIFIEANMSRDLFASFENRSFEEWELLFIKVYKVLFYRDI